jgi:hypothetical protein
MVASRRVEKMVLWSKVKAETELSWGEVEQQKRDRIAQINHTLVSLVGDAPGAGVVGRGLGAGFRSVE